MDVRPATSADDAALAEIDRLTWTDAVSPAPPTGPSPGPTTFFGDDVETRDVLVATEDGGPIGYVRLGAGLPIPARAHVRTVAGLAVHPRHARRGAGRRLVDAAIDEARRRGVRKLTLRVLADNTAALGLYRAAGFVVEGVLRAEFRVGDRCVDDVLMARHLVGT